MMENNQITKKQHFIPNFLIKRWRNDSNEILIVDKGGIPQKISFDENKKYFSDTFLYEMSEGTTNELEKLLSKIEEKYAQLTEKIIAKTNRQIFFAEYANENDVALIETFSRIQFFRNKDYWNLINENKNDILEYLKNLIDAYFQYTKMSNKEKDKKTESFLLEVRKIQMGNYNFDNAEYLLHELYSSPKYFLTHALNTYKYFAMPFYNELPISNSGQFKVSSDSEDNFYCYITPVSPQVGIVKSLNFDDNDKEHLKILIEPLLNKKQLNAAKILCFSELKMFSKYTVIPFSYNDDKNIFEDFSSVKVKMRVRNKKNKKNTSLIK
jgi:hypothetical protein